MNLKKSGLLMSGLALVLTLTACGNNTGASNSTDPNQPLSGFLLAVGSSALQPLVEQAGQKFMADPKYSGVQVQVQGGGSGTGITQVSNGQADIGNSDVFVEEKLKGPDAHLAKELIDHQVAVVAISIVTNKDTGVDSLTKQQMVDIFSGKVRNWKDVGGVDEKIVIVNRPSSSGTRSTFEKSALGTKVEDMAGAILEESSGTVRKIISETPGAIGYVSFSYLNDSIKSIKYDGVEAIVENVISGDYPVWAYEHMYTKGEPDKIEKAFLDYMISDEIQNKDVVELGYIPASQMKVSRDADGNITKK